MHLHVVFFVLYPGPVIDSRGNEAQSEYWPVRMDEYYHAANHQEAEIKTIDGWNHPEGVAQAVRGMVL